MISYQEIQTLITEIDQTLEQNTEAESATAERRMLEKVRWFLQSWQNQRETTPLVSKELSALEQATAQDIAQGVMAQLNLERGNWLHPFQMELEHLRQQREALLREIRQLEGTRSQLTSDFLQVLLGRCSDDLRHQLAEILEQFEEQLLAQNANPPTGQPTGSPLRELDRLEQLRSLQEQTDHLLRNLDRTLRTVVNSVERDLQSHQSSLSQGLERIQELGQQGETLLSNYVQQFQQAPIPLALPQEPEKEPIPAFDESSDSPSQEDVSYFPFAGLEVSDPSPQQQSLDEPVDVLFQIDLNEHPATQAQRELKQQGEVWEDWEETRLNPEHLRQSWETEEQQPMVLTVDEEEFGEHEPIPDEETPDDGEEGETPARELTPTQDSSEAEDSHTPSDVTPTDTDAALTPTQDSSEAEDSHTPPQTSKFIQTPPPAESVAEQPPLTPSEPLGEPTEAESLPLAESIAAEPELTDESLTEETPPPSEATLDEQLFEGMADPSQTPEETVEEESEAEFNSPQPVETALFAEPTPEPTSEPPESESPDIDPSASDQPSLAETISSLTELLEQASETDDLDIFQPSEEFHPITPGETLLATDELKNPNQKQDLETVLDEQKLQQLTEDLAKFEGESNPSAATETTETTETAAEEAEEAEEAEGQEDSATTPPALKPDPVPVPTKIIADEEEVEEIVPLVPTLDPVDTSDLPSEDIIASLTDLIWSEDEEDEDGPFFSTVETQQQFVQGTSPSPQEEADSSTTETAQDQDETINWADFPLDSDKDYLPQDLASEVESFANQEDIGQDQEWETTELEEFPLSSEESSPRGLEEEWETTELEEFPVTAEESSPALTDSPDEEDFQGTTEETPSASTETTVEHEQFNEDLEDFWLSSTPTSPPPRPKPRVQRGSSPGNGMESVTEITTDPWSDTPKSNQSKQSSSAKKTQRSKVYRSPKKPQKPD